ncbi:LysR family transcriptional regulator [Dietzia sp. 179-F 9C3 NHS]|uniref:LysR family transcriptional regulator n=1 Tax=Dietzia sp. 179-F 9C3 NHS TaxID=3374295 RepID=UPI0038791EA0
MSVPTHLPDLAALDVLVVVARRGSMGSAAEELGLSQQAVSARVRSAETLLGVAVFRRSARGVQLTAAGRSVVTWADELLRAAAEFDGRVADLRGDPRAGATIAASNTVLEWLFPQWAARLRGRAPEARITVRPGNSGDVIDAVRRGEVDLGFVESPGVPRDLDSLDVAIDELLVVVPPAHRWARAREPLTVRELAATPLIVREPGSGTRSTFEEVLRARGLEPAAPLMELGSTASVTSVVITADAPAVLSSLAVRGAVESGRLAVVPVADASWPRVLRAVWLRGRRPRGVAADLLHVATADR